MTKSLAWVFIIAVSFSAFAASPYLVKDINTLWPAGANSSSPQNFVELPGRTLFVASSLGHQLWVTDGTTAGTRKLADADLGTYPTIRRVGNIALFFAAGTTAATGRELWRTDGAPEGTFLVKDIDGKPSDSVTTAAVVLNGRLIFPARTTDRYDLWTSDGTAAGTQLWFAQPSGPYPTVIADAAAVNGLVISSDSTGIWATNGATREDLFPNAGVALTVVGSKLFFAGRDTSTGYELWVTDGTKAGTHIVRDINPGPASGAGTGNMVVVGSRVLFESIQGNGTNIWVSDGTEAGTQPLGGLKQIDPHEAPLQHTATSGGYVYFVFYHALWRTDGTDAGTTQLTPAGATNVWAVGGSGSTLYLLQGGNEQKAATLYTYDPANNSTHTVYASNGEPLMGTSSLFSTGALGSRTILSARVIEADESEPWITDGTSSGTFELKDVATNPPASSNPILLTAMGNSLAFVAMESTANQFWMSDGTEAGTRKISDLTPPSYLAQHFSWNDLAIMREGSRAWAIDPSGKVIQPDLGNVLGLFPGPDAIYGRGSPDFRWDGRSLSAQALDGAIGLGPVVDYIGKPFSCSGQGLVLISGTHVETINKTLFRRGTAVLNGFLYLLGGSTQLELWRSDGTPTGTTLVASFPKLTQLGDVVVAGSRMFFMASDHDRGSVVMTSDGTAAGTYRVADTLTFASSPLPLTAWGESIAFAGWDIAHGFEPWISDGTPEGTRMVKDIFPGALSSDPTYLTAFAGRLYFIAGASSNQRQVFVTDGTEAGTTTVGNFAGSGFDNQPWQLTVAGKRLFFAASDSATGMELWAYEPDPISRITIDDVRVPEGQPARFNVTLTSPNNHRVTVDYATADSTATAGADYAAASGTLVFEPGETQKQIVVNTLPDSIDENYEVFRVALTNPAGAGFERRSGAALIEGQTPAADLAVTTDVQSGYNVPVVTIRNNGPATVVKAITRSSFTTSTDTTFDLAAGQTHSAPQLSPFQPSGSSGLWWFSVSTEQRESSLTNNILVGRYSNGGSGLLSYAPADLHPGQTATLDMLTPASGPLTATSSNPAVVSVGSVTGNPGHATATLTANAPGTATISVLSVGDITVTVLGPGETIKFNVQLTISLSSAPQVGKASVAAATIFGSGPYSLPSGTLTLLDGASVLATQNVTGPYLNVPFDPGPIGHHTLTLRYSGDAYFAEASIPFTYDTVVKGEPSIGFAFRQSSNGSTEVTVTVTGSPRATPAGSLAIALDGSPATALPLVFVSPGVASRTAIFNLTAGRHIFTASYLGDDNYQAATASAPTAPKRRSAPH